MSQEQFLVIVAAVVVANTATVAAAYALFFMYWREKKTGLKDWPLWMPVSIAVPLIFAGVVILTLVIPSGH